MNKRIKIIFSLTILIKAGLLFADNSRDALIYLSSFVKSLVNQSDHISQANQSLFPVNHGQIKNKIRQGSDRDSTLILQQIIKPEEITTELINSSISWIVPYLKNDKNFDFLQTLSSAQIKDIKERVLKKAAEIFNLKHKHEREMRDLNASQTQIIKPRELKIEQALEVLKENRDALLGINQKDLFLRLVGLTPSQLKNLYNFDNFSYPVNIENETNLDKFKIPDLTIYYNDVRSLLKLKQELSKDLQNKSDAFLKSDENNKNIQNYFDKLYSIIDRVNKSFIDTSSYFDQLVKDSLAALSNVRLKGPKAEFDKGLNGLDYGQKQQVQRSITTFINSASVRFYLFSGEPIVSLFKSGKSLNEDFKSMISQSQLLVESSDIHMLYQWIIEQIFEYATAPYSHEEEEYYSRLFGYFYGEIDRLEKFYKSDSSLYQEIIKQLSLVISYKDIIKLLKTLRNEYLLPLFKVGAAIKRNPYNERFRNELVHVKVENVKDIKDLFIQLAASQFFLKEQIITLTDKYLTAIDRHLLLPTIRKAEIREGENKYDNLSDYIKSRVDVLKNESLNYWTYLTSVNLLKAAIDTMAHTAKQSGIVGNFTQTIKNFLSRRRLALMDEEEEENQEFNDYF